MHLCVARTYCISRTPKPLLEAANNRSACLQVAREHARLHLRATHAEFAKALEAVGDVSAAIHHYEEAGIAAQEVPRMLLQRGDAAALERYVQVCSNPIPQS